VSFNVNQDTIAKTLCLKKETKNNTCKGRCHLKKQLDKVDEEEKKQVPTNPKEKVEVLYCHDQGWVNLLKQTLFYENSSVAEYKSDFYANSFIEDIFIPPKRNLI
jgi:hypothetical protein